MIPDETTPLEFDNQPSHASQLHVLNDITKT